MAPPCAVSAAQAPAQREPPAAEWVVDPAVPGENLPSAGRSLFDFLVVRNAADGRKAYDVPFPISALLQKIEAGLENDRSSGMPVKRVLIPLGRSLQRTAAAPHYFAYPRVVAVPDAEPRASGKSAGVLFKDRLYLGYQEKANVIEVISYNEAAGRFEFQIVKDYRAGGSPQVFYANRAICTACHQNAAPIFSRPVWNETNANARVAVLLKNESRSFYGMTPNRGVDIPNAIDDATDRANLYSTYQLLWRTGCAVAGSSEKAARCRAALFTAALQYRLSGKQQFAANSAAFRSGVSDTFARGVERWPGGLQIPNPDIPNRDPFAQRTAYAAGARQVESSNTADALTDLVDVQPAFDPLTPRAPLERWSAGDAGITTRLVAGLSEFIAESDVRRLDAHLGELDARSGAARVMYEANCEITQTRQEKKESRVDFECPAAPDGPEKSFTGAGRFYTDGRGVTRGIVERLKLDADPALTAIAIPSGTVSRAGATVTTTLQAERGGRRARRGDGSAVVSVQFTWRATADTGARSSAPAHAVLTVVNDFVPVHEAIESMLKDSGDGKVDAFADLPFRRASVMPALFERLGMPALEWCCVDANGMPPPGMEAHVSAGEATEQAAVKPLSLQPFYRYCATCHQTADRFPPNFLQGSVAQVTTNLAHCAPRLYARLSMWQVDPAERAKTPMPPFFALHGFRFSPETWRKSGELVALTAYVERALQTETGKAPRLQELLRPGYENLRGCLPDSG